MDSIPAEIRRKSRSSHGTCQQNRKYNKNSGQPYSKLVNAEPVPSPGKKIPTTVSTSYSFYYNNNFKVNAK